MSLLLCSCSCRIKAVVFVQKSTKHDLKTANQPRLRDWDRSMRSWWWISSISSCFIRPSVWFWWFMMLRLWGNHFRLLNVLFILQIFCKAGSVLHRQVRVPPFMSLCSVLQPLTTHTEGLDTDPPHCVCSSQYCHLSHYFMDAWYFWIQHFNWFG